MYYKTTTKAGMTIEVVKSCTKRIGTKSRGNKKKPTPEEIEKVNQMNAERKLRLLINANFGEDDLYVTLTYKKGEWPTPKEGNKNIKKLIKELRKNFRKLGAELKYIYVTEHKKKALHHHMLINHIPGADTSKIVRTLWKFGHPHFEYLDYTGQYKKIASYLIKETAKTFKEHDGGHMQRYTHSRNLVIPVSETEIIAKAKKWLDEPKPIKGYYIDKETVYNGTDPFTGKKFQKYTMVKISGSSG